MLCGLQLVSNRQTVSLLVTVKRFLSFFIDGKWGYLFGNPSDFSKTEAQTHFLKYVFKGVLDCF